MNPASKNKLLIWLVLILVLANAVTIGTFWLNRKKEEDHELPRGTTADFLIRELNLDAKQQEQYREFIDEHRQTVQPIREAIRKKKDSLFGLLGQHSPEADSIRTRILSGSLLEKFRDLEQVTFDHFQKLRAICTPEQQKKFDAIIKQAMAMMAPAGPPEGPHGPGPNGERPPPRQF